MKALFTLLTILTSLLTLAQNNDQNITGSVWVTVNDPAILPQHDDNGNLRSSSPDFQAMIESYNITSVSQALPSSRKEELLKVYEVRCNCNSDDLIGEMLKSHIGLHKPEPGPEYELLYTPDDYSIVFSDDYALELINAEGAWEITHGDTTVEIAISDSNYDLNHEEFVDQITYVQQPNSNTNYYHGTAVAITAAGSTNNGTGKSSIGFDSKLQLYAMSYNSILTATYSGARVINVSWTSSCGFISSYIINLVDEVYENGSIIVAAAGNGGTCGGPNNYVYPAAIDKVFAVTSVGPYDNHERYIGDPNSTHQHNDKVDLAAPGYDVPLTVSSGWYLTGNGTSFAAPYVSGTIGLMLSVNPCLSVEDIEYILKATAVNIDSLNPAYAGLLGAGRLDAAAAVEMAQNFYSLQLNTTTGFNCTPNSGVIQAAVIDSVGTAPFNFSWSNGATTQDISGLTSGTYYVEVEDASGCKGIDTAVLIVPDMLSVDAVITDNTCYGEVQGSIEALVSGGTPGYTYDWDNGNTSSELNGLMEGTYVLTVTDANNCSSTNSFTVNAPTEIEITGNVDNVSCFGIANGAIDVTVTGGTAGYTYDWSNSTSQKNLTGLIAGIYELTVTDESGCVSTQSFEVTEPDQIELEFTTSSINNYSPAGSVDLTVYGGTPDYYYSWSTGSTHEDIFNLESGTYTVTVIDANGCVATGETTVSQLTVGLEEAITPDFNLYPNPASGTSTLQWTGVEIQNVNIYDASGKLVSGNQVQGENQMFIDFLSPGVYYVSLISGNGDALTEKLVITQ